MMVSKMRSITSRFLWQGSYLSLMLHLWSMMLLTDPDGMYPSWLYFGRQTLCNAYNIPLGGADIRCWGEEPDLYLRSTPDAVCTDKQRILKTIYLAIANSLAEFGPLCQRPYQALPQLRHSAMDWQAHGIYGRHAILIYFCIIVSIQFIFIWKPCICFMSGT